ARNIPEIGKALGVTHIIEGSVQEIDGQVRISTQLIDVRTNAHLWAQSYECELADIFTLESGLAKQIVSKLRVRLLPEEKRAIDQPLTQNFEAFDLYLRARNLLDTIASSAETNKNLIEATR